MAIRNRYAEIMAQYAQSQPFSFFGYPSTYTGGYDISQPQAYAYTAPANLYEEIMAQPTMGGGDRRAIDWNPEWTNLSDEAKAAYYAANPGWSRLTQIGQNIFGVTGIGMLQGKTDPDFVARQKLIAQGINPESFAYGPPDPNFSSQASAAARNEAMQSAIAAANAQGGFVANPMSRDPSQMLATAPISAEAQARASLAAQISKEAAEAAADRPSGGGGGSQRGGESVGGYSGAAASRAASGQFGMGPGTAGFNSGGSNFAQGGYVSMQHLGGPDPEGPDDGYAALKDGEFVINDKAVKKYGIELMNAINSGKISKGKLRGLLEM